MNYIYDLIAKLLPTKSVDSIVAILTKVSQRLAAAEAASNARAASLRSQAASLLSQAADEAAEGERAGRVRENLSNLTA